jgi:hypothetical protein
LPPCCLVATLSSDSHFRYRTQFLKCKEFQRAQ